VSELVNFKKILYPATSKRFHVRWINIIAQVIFVAKDVSKIVLKVAFLAASETSGAIST